MPIVPVGSHSVYYEEYGAGHPLVLIAGLSHSRLVYWKQIEQFSCGYRVITSDNLTGNYRLHSGNLQANWY